MVRWIKHSVDRFVIVSIFIPKLRLILILNSFLGSSDSLVFSELFHSLAPRPLAARSISDFLLTYLDVDKQASHFVHIPGLSYSGVKSPTECQQSLFESHFASRQSLSDCPVAF